MMTHEKYLKKLKRNKRIITYVQICIFILIIALWELFTKTNIIDEFIFSSPSKIFKLLFAYIKDGSLYIHILTSTLEVLAGLIIASVVGIIIAILMYEFPFFAKVIDPFLVVFNALPKTALAPIFIIWIGANIKGIIFVAISIAIIITILNAYKAFIDIEEEKIKLFKTFGANKIDILFHLILPGSKEALINIIKINIGMSWIGVIIGEFIVSKAGIGYLIMYGGQVFNMHLVMMGVFVLAIISFFMYKIIDFLEKRLRK